MFNKTEVDAINWGDKCEKKEREKGAVRRDLTKRQRRSELMFNGIGNDRHGGNF